MDIETLLRMTYEEADRAYAADRLTDEQWLAFRCVWRRSAPRFSHIAAEHDRCQGMCGCLTPRS
jgi:hypothetical protein